MEQERDIKSVWSQMLSLFMEFLREEAKRPPFSVAEVFVCSKSRRTRVVIKLSERHSITKNIDEVILDDNLVDGLGGIAIRTLTYVATMESLKPRFQLMKQEIGHLHPDDVRLTVADNFSGERLVKTPSEICRDKNLISKFSVEDINKIAYLAGVFDAVEETEFYKTMTEEIQ